MLLWPVWIETLWLAVRLNVASNGPPHARSNGRSNGRIVAVTGGRAESGAFVGYAID